MGLELEAKFAVKSLEDIRSRLRSSSAKRHDRRFEENILFDTPDRALRSKGELLRLRQSHKTVLTFKKASSKSNIPGIKSMEETETLIDDFDSMRRILGHLGFTEVLRYEKFREVWHLDQVVICLDVVPFGQFMEIEAEADLIAQTATSLGLDMTQAIALSYHELFRQHLEKLGLPPQDGFAFDPREKAALLAWCEG